MNADSNSPNNKLIVGNCLQCQGLVRVPYQTDAKSEVRCPHCASVHSLSEVLEAAVPAMEVLEPGLKVEPATPRVDQPIKIKTDDGDGREKFVVPPQLSEGAKRRRRQQRANDAAEARSKGNSQVGRRRSSSSRHRIREQNPLLEMLKVACGALLAIPVSYLLVMWVFGQDPLNFGPKVSPYVSVLVPENMRGDDSNSDGGKAESAEERSESAGDPSEPADQPSEAGESADQ